VDVVVVVVEEVDAPLESVEDEEELTLVALEVVEPGGREEDAVAEEDEEAGEEALEEALLVEEGAGPPVLDMLLLPEGAEVLAIEDVTVVDDGTELVVAAVAVVESKPLGQYDCTAMLGGAHDSCIEIVPVTGS
jgi:hypothetical protein